MTYVVKRIDEQMYGCEEPAPGAEVLVDVTLVAPDGVKRVLPYRIHQHDSLESAAAGEDKVHLCPPWPGRRVEQLLQHSGSRHRQCKQRQLVPNRPVQHVDLVFLMLLK